MGPRNGKERNNNILSNTMRSLEEAQARWTRLQAHQTLDSLRQSTGQGDGNLDGVRSAYWKALLLFQDVDTQTWSERLQAARNTYTSLQSHYLRNIHNPDELDTFDDPLSEDVNSQWNAMRQDEASRAEIFRDVERCMPDNLYFRQPQTQETLLDILFIWSKLNQDVGYRQGMHEILAPILWVIERDAVDTDSSALEEQPSALVVEVFSSAYIAHDTFTLFGLVMQHHKTSYSLTPANPSSASSRAASTLNSDSPMVRRSGHIMDVLLVKVDPALANHLKEIEIVPQVFLIRWIRLLFGREFSFDHLLELWDRMFSNDPLLERIDLICVAMLLRIRWRLLEADYDTALPLLLRYPELPADQPPHTLVDDALYLHNNLNAQCGAHIIQKYTKRLPVVVDPAEPSTPRTEKPQHLSAQPSPRRAFSPLVTPSRFMSETGGFEALLQDAARGVYLRGEKWGVNKAVRDAVGEVRKNVSTFQSRSGTPSRSEDFGVGPSSVDSSEAVSTEDLLKRLEELQTRNKALAKMLESAVGDLWSRQEDSPANSEKTKAFTMAVAKVQLVQVYLDDPFLHLTVEDLTSEDAKPTDSTISQTHPTATSAAQISTSHTQTNPDPAPILEHTNTPKTADPIPAKSEKPATQAQVAALPITSLPKREIATPTRTPTTRKAPSTATPQSSRPSLQSNLSWMLGQPPQAAAKDADSTFTPSRSLFGSPYAESSPYSTSPDKKSKSRDVNSSRSTARSERSFLFGDVEDLAPAAASGMGALLSPSQVEESRGHKRTDSKARNGRQKGSADAGDVEEGDEVFRLGTMRR